jgi:thiol-disulfide isomerase/thioredoxin
MTTTTRKRRPAPPAARQRSRVVVWAAAAAVVLLALVVAVVASRGGGGPTTATGTEQTRPVTVTGAALPAYGTGTDPAVGAAAPELYGASFDGTPVNVTHDGRGKLLLFVAHWCPHCQREVPLVVEHLRSALPEGVDLVAVATSTSRDRPNYPPSSWLDRVGWTAPVLADDAGGSAATAYGLSGFPYFVAVDRAGKVVARTSGEISVADFDRLARAAAA